MLQATELEPEAEGDSLECMCAAATVELSTKARENVETRHVTADCHPAVRNPPCFADAHAGEMSSRSNYQARHRRRRQRWICQCTNSDQSSSCSLLCTTCVCIQYCSASLGVAA